MKNPAKPDHPIQSVIAERYSPYWFSDQEVSQRDLLALLEAARWAPSAYNEQPWSYLVATAKNESAFKKLLGCLVEGNQGWAASARVLMVGLTRTAHKANGNPNVAAQHDLGLAAATMTVEATARGISVHQMSGIVADKIRDTYHVPDDVIPLTGIAIGYAADPSEVPERYRERQIRERVREPFSAFVFTEKFGTPAKLG